MKIHW